jgi:hypothetical protein
MSDLQGMVPELCPPCNPSRKRYATVPGTEKVRLLTQTSKMPGPSWSLPAGKSCPRACGTICANCYASKGCYSYPSTRNAQAARFDWTVQSMRTPEGRTSWVSTMVDAITKSGAEYFRVHDSGDMFNISYAQSWLEVCRMLPEVKFWIPTRAWQAPRSVLPTFDPLLDVLRQLAMLPNVVVRPSALNFGDHAPSVEGLHAGSTAEMPDVFRAFQCPAPGQGGMCCDCRTCWTSKDLPVSYSRH